MSKEITSAEWMLAANITDLILKGANLVKAAPKQGSAATYYLHSEASQKEIVYLMQEHYRHPSLLSPEEGE